MPLYLPPISRRQFLAGSLAAGAGLFLPAGISAAEPAVDPNRWVLLSDTHISERREGVYRGTKPAANLAQAVREILALDPRPAGVVHAGDVAFGEGLAADYAVFGQLIAPIRAAGIPLHIALGNHDHRANFRAAFPDAKSPPGCDRQVAVIPARQVNWYLLDSLDKTNSTPGRLGKPQLDWLAGALDARAKTPAILVAHHDLGSLRGLRDAETLVELAAARKQVKAYFFGHTHAWAVGKQDQQNKFDLVNIPTTAWTFDPFQPRGWVDMTLRAGGATLVLQSLNPDHAKHGERVELKWAA
jgi:3',5'-cyclic AMP phosphodiesterase CpdA